MWSMGYGGHIRQIFGWLCEVDTQLERMSEWELFQLVLAGGEIGVDSADVGYESCVQWHLWNQMILVIGSGQEEGSDEILVRWS